MTVKVRDVAPGLWLWRLEHPDYRGDDPEWDGKVACVCVESGGEVALLDPHGMTAPDGELRVWNAAEHERWTLPALRAMLELPFEHVIVSHGEPVHDRPAFERALELPPWGASWPDGG